jgi:AcrR family transcriptional regulator
LSAGTRLTRKERQADTRARLMASASSVAAQRGLEGASLDEIAHEAGFTKGAIYANFEGKEGLFLAMLEDHFDARLADIDRVLSGGAAPVEQARQAGADFTGALSSEPEWERLFLELVVYAARNESFRLEFVARYAQLRERIVELFERRARELDLEPPIPPAAVVAMSFAMANGTAVERMLEPEAIPDDLLPTMMATFFSGLKAQSEQCEAD